MTSRDLDSLDRLILNAIQSGFPVAARPYAALAARLNEAHNLNLTEDEMLGRVTALRQDGFIRRLGGGLQPPGSG
jgi:DNA-binding Lrp family transcriptional regulator